MVRRLAAGVMDLRFKPPVARVHLHICFSRHDERGDLFIGIQSSLGTVDLGSNPARAFGFNRVISMGKL